MAGPAPFLFWVLEPSCLDGVCWWPLSGLRSPPPPLRAVRKRRGCFAWNGHVLREPGTGLSCEEGGCRSWALGVVSGRCCPQASSIAVGASTLDLAQCWWPRVQYAVCGLCVITGIPGISSAPGLCTLDQLHTEASISPGCLAYRASLWWLGLGSGLELLLQAPDSCGCDPLPREQGLPSSVAPGPGS